MLLVNKRLMNWCEENNIISDLQGGFRIGSGCPDQIFILSEVLKSPPPSDQIKIFAVANISCTRLRLKVAVATTSAAFGSAD